MDYVHETFCILINLGKAKSQMLRITKNDIRPLHNHYEYKQPHKRYNIIILIIKKPIKTIKYNHYVHKNQSINKLSTNPNYIITK